MAPWTLTLWQKQEDLIKDPGKYLKKKHFSIQRQKKFFITSKMKVLLKSFCILLWNTEERGKYKTSEEQQKQKEEEKVNLKAKFGCYCYSLSTF